MINQMQSKKGFTLIEIGIVLFVVGILVAVFMPTFSQDIKSTAKIKGLMTQVEKFNVFVSQVQSACNIATPGLVLSNIPDTGKHIFNVYNEGVSAVAPAYTGCFNTANIKANAVFKQGTFPGHYAGDTGWGFDTFNIGQISWTTNTATGKGVVQLAIGNMNKEDLVYILNTYGGRNLNVSTYSGGMDFSHPNYNYLNYLLYIAPNPS